VPTAGWLAANGSRTDRRYHLASVEVHGALRSTTSGDVPASDTVPGSLSRDARLPGSRSRARRAPGGKRMRRARASPAPATSMRPPAPKTGKHAFRAGPSPRGGRRLRV